MDRNDKIKYTLVVVFLVTVFAYSFLRDNNKSEKLKNVKSTYGTFDKYFRRTVKDDECGYFHYTVSGKTYTFREAGNYSYSRKGDSVEIEYSIEEPSIARVK